MQDNLQNDLNEQYFKKTAKILGIPVDFVRKDFYVTKAIEILTNVKNDYFRLIFQGGTSLANQQYNEFPVTKPSKWW